MPVFEGGEMRYNTLGIGIFFIAVAGGMAWITAFEQEAPVMDMISPRRITYIFLALLGFFGVLLTGVGLKEAARGGSASLQHTGRLAAFITISILYALGLSYIGYYAILTPIMLFATLMLLKVRPLTSLAIAVIFSAAVYLVFHIVLGVPLP